MASTMAPRYPAGYPDPHTIRNRSTSTPNPPPYSKEYPDNGRYNKRNSNVDYHDYIPVTPGARSHKSHRPHKSHSARRPSRSTRTVKTDVIDHLDTVANYHHEGPYDPASPERNRVLKRSPIDALKFSNEEALKATPHDKVVDAVQGHRPLDGVAWYAPGATDHNGHTYEYQEGQNVVAQPEGNFRRIPGEKFRDEDFKNDPIYNAPKRSSKRLSWLGRGGPQKRTT